MKAYLSSTANLGDFLNGYPVISGLVKKFDEPMELVIKKEMRKFKGIKEFLMYQGIFSKIHFDDEIIIYGDNMYQLSSWWHETKNNPDRPTETCRYENFVKDNYKIDFEVDDDVEIKFPTLDIDIDPDVLYFGDRWDVGDIDKRRECHLFKKFIGQTKIDYINYDNDLLTNCYIIKNCKDPFISNFTGVGILADLLKKETWIVWRAEDWNEEFRTDDGDISWDNGKNIKEIFEKHMYQNRKCSLIHRSIVDKFFA